MKHKWLAATALAGVLALGPALAQQGQQQEQRQKPQTTEQQPVPERKEQQPSQKLPEQQPPAGQQKPEQQQPEQMPSEEQPPLKEKQPQTEEQKAGTVPAMGKEQLLGKELYGSENRRIGKIKDVVVNPQGKVEAVVIKVGGFFGFGGKPVAVPADELQAQGDRIVAAHLTQKDIQGLPSYEKTEGEQSR